MSNKKFIPDYEHEPAPLEKDYGWVSPEEDIDILDDLEEYFKTETYGSTLGG